MKKIDFDLNKSRSRPVSEEEQDEASRYLQQYADKLREHVPDLFAWGPSAKEDGTPCILIWVQTGLGEKYKDKIPDTLGKYEVYYIETERFRSATS